MNHNIIILTNGESFEAWGSLSELCKVKGFSYNYLKRLKFPFKYKEFNFIRVPFRQENSKLIQFDSNNIYCVRKKDLFSLTTPKVAENLSKKEAEIIKNKMQTKSISENNCPLPIFFVSKI